MFEDIPRLEDLGVSSGQSVLVRADLNVPLLTTRDGTTVVADDFRIRAALPTLRWLADRGLSVTVASHLGRPKGRPVPALSMAPVRKVLSEVLPGIEVTENLRFDPGEEGDDPAFGERLVAGHDLYVNDAFGVCHRAHASVMYPPTVLPSGAGLLLEAELAALGRIIEGTDRPFTVVVGGAKVADKIGTIRALARHTDRLIIGGAMAHTFLVAQGRSVGDSAVEADELEACKQLLDSDCDIELPSDFLAGRTGEEGEAEAKRGTLSRFKAEIPSGWRGLDIGPVTRERFTRRIAGSSTVLWNGPMGVFEDPRCVLGTNDVAAAIAACPGFTVAGGGDTLAAIRSLNLEGRYSHLSTGGGAMLALIERRGDLPALRALRRPA